MRALKNRWRPRTNIQTIFHAKWRLLCLLSFKYSFGNWEISLRHSLVIAGGIFSQLTCLDQSCASKNILWVSIRTIF